MGMMIIFFRSIQFNGNMAYTYTMEGALFCRVECLVNDLFYHFPMIFVVVVTVVVAVWILSSVNENLLLFFILILSVHFPKKFLYINYVL